MRVSLSYYVSQWRWIFRNSKSVHYCSAIIGLGLKLWYFSIGSSELRSKFDIIISRSQNNFLCVKSEKVMKLSLTRLCYMESEVSCWAQLKKWCALKLYMTSHINNFIINSQIFIREKAWGHWGIPQIKFCSSSSSSNGNSSLLHERPPHWPSG